jgi:hypothetical protein
VLAAPWVNQLLPSRAGAVLAAARRRDFVIASVVALLILAATIAVLAMWSDTETYDWVPATSGPATSGAWESQTRTLPEVWSDWHSEPVWWWGPAETLAALTFVLTPLSLAALAWLQWPRVHRTGSAWASYRRAVRVVAAGLAPATIATALIVSCFILYEHEMILSDANIDPATLGVWLVGGTVCGVIAWSGRAASGGAPEHADLDVPPRCEGCGYDLTHQPADGRCTECGLKIAVSLTPGRTRPDNRWMRERGLESWLRTTWTIVFSPRRFYGSLKLRTPGTTERGFAVWNYFLIACGACVWGSAMVLFLSALYGPAPDLGGILFAVCGAAVWATLGCWCGHRVIAAAVTSWWLLRNPLPDGRWAAKVIAYESAFLWVFCCFWGVLASSIACFQDWISDLFAPDFRWRLGMPVEFWALLLGTSVLGAVWLWRYRIAYRAIRWSNF